METDIDNFNLSDVIDRPQDYMESDYFERDDEDDTIYFDQSFFLIDGNDDSIEIMVTDWEDAPTLSEMLANANLDYRGIHGKITRNGHDIPMARNIEMLLISPDAKDIRYIEDMEARGIRTNDGGVTLTGQWVSMADRPFVFPWRTRSYLDTRTGMILETTLAVRLIRHEDVCQ